MDKKIKRKKLKHKMENELKETVLKQNLESIYDPSDQFEPLPFYDNDLLKEKIYFNCMKINVNPYLSKKFIFIPNKPVKIQITAEKDDSQHHILQTFKYRIKIEHDKYVWQVIRGYKDFKEVQKSLSKLVKAQMGVSPSNIQIDQIKSDWPLFPLKNDHLVEISKINIRCKELELYLERVLRYPPYRDHTSITNLLSVSPLSFLNDLGPSHLEGMLLKKVGENLIYGGCRKSRNCCEIFKFCYDDRWTCVKDTYIVYLNPSVNNIVGFVMLVDSDFECKKKHAIGAYHSLEIKNMHRSIILKCKNSHQQKEWFEKINEMISTTGKEFHDKKYLIYDSFAPTRKNQLCRWFLNGSTYMMQVMNGLNNAKEEIFIADWWLCPELYLKRPTDDLQYRLDKILHKKAKEGVKIYVLLYKEIKFALNLMSLRTRQILTDNGVNPNIKVLRHPDHFLDGVFLWSHHEKFIVIDQSVAFIGGIDLCFGRWDDEFHRLVDLGKMPNKTEIEFTESMSSNTPILVESHSESNLKLMNTRPMGFRNKSQSSEQHLASLIKINEKAMKSLSKQNETEYKMVQAFTLNKKEVVDNMSSKSNLQIIFDKTKKNLNNKALVRTKNLKSQKSKNIINSKISQKLVWITDNKDLKKRKLNGLKNIFRATRNFKMKSNIDDDIYDRWHFSSKINQSFVDLEEVDLPKNTDIGYYYWIGKDYCNSYREDFKEIQEFSKDQFNRNDVPRMPWRDEAAIVIGESARDLARHFIQRWNQCKNEQVPFIETYPYLIPKSYTETFQYNHEWFLPDLYKCETQILRSVDDWSAGISQTESSILKAYCDLIRKAEHYIYIENQFFITSTDGSKDEVKNEIGLALAERIKIAHNKKERFRVYIFLPLLPGFDRLNAIKAIQYYNLRSINIGEYSIYHYLKKEGVNDPSEYISFHGMRNWAVLMGKLVQEIIYIHSKLMIIDDKYVICGSANINDRSMLGKRDSEVAILIKDEEFVENTFGNLKVNSGKYAITLRQKIFRLHLGIYFNNPNQINVNDCVSDEFYHMFRSVSKQNTMIYDEVFKCLPSNSILTFNDLKNYPKQPSLNKINPVEGKAKLEKYLMGLVVDFPLNFLSHEKNFFPDFDTPEGIFPTETWT